MNKCCICNNKKDTFIFVPMYGFVCGCCYQEIITNYLK